jgi:hypothetical protein
MGKKFIMRKKIWKNELPKKCKPQKSQVSKKLKKKRCKLVENLKNFNEAQVYFF